MSDNALIRALRSFGQGASNAVASNVSVPVDGLAWLLRKGGLPIPQNPVGGSDWMAQQGLTATPQNRIAGLLGETAGMVGPAVVQAAAPKIAGGLLALDDKAMDMARQGIERRMVNSGMIQPATVWHGSPHKFDKFDSSKIGTGEGAQAYGHGLYLAESDTVAKQYADNVKDMGAIQNINARLSALAKEMDNYRGGEYGKFTSPKGYELKAEYDALMASRSGVSQAPGNMYKVDLPDNAIARMLDWDKPLSQQAPEVRAALQKHGIGGSPAWDEITGVNLINQLGQRLDPSNTSAAASKALQKAGIPGIRYLDGGSRGAGQGSSNFVVFPGQEDILKILERNGVPIK